MFTQVDFEYTSGKTIKTVIRTFSNEVVVLFTDSTYSVIGACQSEPGESELDMSGLLSVTGDSYEQVFKPLFGEHANAMYDKAVLAIEYAEAEASENR